LTPPWPRARHMSRRPSNRPTSAPGLTAGRVLRRDGAAAARGARRVPRPLPAASMVRSHRRLHGAARCRRCQSQRERGRSAWVRLLPGGAPVRAGGASAAWNGTACECE
jgi:hypothetical protein